MSGKKDSAFIGGLSTDGSKDFAAFFEQSAAGFVFTDLKGQILKCNESFASHALLRPQELVGQRLVGLTAPEARPLFEQELQKLALGQLDHLVTEQKILRKDGSTVWGLFTCNPVRDTQGTPSFLSVLFEDRTAQKLRELESQREHSLVEAVIRNVPSMIFVKDFKKNLSFSMFNKAGEDLLGLQEKDLLGKTDYDLFPKEQADFFCQKDREVFKNRGTLSIAREEIDTTKGKRILSTKKVPVFDLNGEPHLLIGISNDITDEVLAKAALERERHLTLHQAKLASLGEMAGGIAHEINNPLAIVLGKSQQLLRQIQSAAFNTEHVATELNKIIQTANRIAKIVKGLNSISRNGARDPMVKCELKTLVSDVLGLCSENLRVHAIDLKIAPVPDLALLGRSVQLEQVFLNLLNNAKDAVATLPEKWIEIGFKTLEEKLQILVIDSGKGVPPEVAEKLMQPFFTTKAVGKGTGLGLSISKGIIEDHGGNLFYDPSSIHTCFVMELPLLQKIK